MHAKRPFALLLGAAGASMSAGAGMRYYGEDPLSTPNAAGAATCTDAPTNTTSSTTTTTTTTNTIATRNKTPPLVATTAHTKQALGLDQSLARDVACWISAASVYAARQAFDASTARHAVATTTKQLLSASDAMAATSSLDSNQQLTVLGPTASSSTGVYRTLFGWLQELTPAAAHWDAEPVLQSSSFTMLLNVISSTPLSATAASTSHTVRDDLERELFHAVGALATNAQCARTIAERATRYGKRALLHLAQRHDDDPRVGAALQRLVVLDDAAHCHFGPANLVSLLSLAVAPHVPDAYCEFALWALRQAASSDRTRSLKYEWRKTLFGGDVAMETKRKLLANKQLWETILATAEMDNNNYCCSHERVQLEAARLLRTLSDDGVGLARALERLDDPQRVANVLLQWLDSPNTPLASTALDVVAQAANANEALRMALRDNNVLNVLRKRLQADSDCRLTAPLLRAVLSVAAPLAAEPLEMPSLLDKHALSFTDTNDEDEDEDEEDALHVLHADDFISNNTKRPAPAVAATDGWIDLLTTELRTATDPQVQALAIEALQLLASPHQVHYRQSQCAWLWTILDAATPAAATSVPIESHLKRKRTRTRPLGAAVSANSIEANATAADASLVLALQALARNADTCRNALTQLGGVALLESLLQASSLKSNNSNSTSDSVTRGVARVIANLLASDNSLRSRRFDSFAAASSLLTQMLATWSASSDVHLQALAHRAVVNRRRYINNDASSSSNAPAGVTYVDGVYPLHSVDAPPSTPFDVDVVFVHGLLGNPLSTWMCGDDPQTNWPHAWLVDDLVAAGRSPRVLSISYDAQLFAADVSNSNSSSEALSFQLTSDAIAAKLDAAHVGHNGRDVVFVTHSLGGVLLKQLLHDSSASTAPAATTAAPALVDSVRGVLFYGVPHRGSPVAQTLRSLASPSLGLAQHPVTEHLHGSAHAAVLNDACHQLFTDRSIAALSVGETRPCRLPVVGIEALLVPLTSADPGFGTFVAVPDATHMSVCKPQSVTDVRYELARDFVLACCRGVESSEARE